LTLAAALYAAGSRFDGTVSVPSIDRCSSVWRVCCCGHPRAGYIDRLLHSRRPAATAPQQRSAQQRSIGKQCYVYTFYSRRFNVLFYCSAFLHLPIFQDSCKYFLSISTQSTQFCSLLFYCIVYVFINKIFIRYSRCINKKN